MELSGSSYAINKNKYLLEPEAQKLEELLEHYRHRDSRNCMMLFTALYTGARAREILNLKFSDLNPYESSLFIKGVKNSRDREIPLRSWHFAGLEKLKSPQGAKQKFDDELIFPISYQRLRQIWTLYRPTPKKFHCLRHTFAIRLFKKTKDLRLVQLALGHRNIMNTMVYADYIYSQEEMKRLIL